MVSPDAPICLLAVCHCRHYSFIHSLTHLLAILLMARSLTHSLAQSFTHSYTRSLCCVELGWAVLRWAALCCVAAHISSWFAMTLPVLWSQALNGGRRLVAHHPGVLGPQLHSFVLLALPSVEALRSTTTKIGMLLLQV